MTKQEIFKLVGIIVITLVLVSVSFGFGYTGGPILGPLIVLILINIGFRGKSSLYTRKDWVKYVPWLVLVAFILIEIGFFAYEVKVDRRDYLQRQQQLNNQPNIIVN